MISVMPLVLLRFVFKLSKRIIESVQLNLHFAAFNIILCFLIKQKIQSDYSQRHIPFSVEIIQCPKS